MEGVSFKGWRYREASSLGGRIVFFGHQHRAATFVLGQGKAKEELEVQKEGSSFKYKQTTEEDSFKTRKGSLYAFPSEISSEVHVFSLSAGDWRKHS